ARMLCSYLGQISNLVRGPRSEISIISVTESTDLNELIEKEPWLSSSKLVVKPDMLFGKRGKSGLVALNLELAQVIKPVIEEFIKSIYSLFVDLDFTFLEMNPFTLVDGKPYPLDMRGELDDTAAFKNFKKWGNIEFPLPFGRVMSATESFIHGLDEKVGKSHQSLSIGDLGFASELGNYAEYSGAPNEDEVLQYARVVIDCATADPDGQKRALVESKLKAANMHIYVRRGGPNYQKGLARMRALGDEIGIPIEVYGPEATMTGICKQAIECITASA
ncbi:ATP-citrate synthase alpha chain protein 2, partial [Tanacetum coccineum]